MSTAATDGADPDIQPATISIWKPALKEAGWAFLCAGVLVSLCYAVFFRCIHPEFVPFMGHDTKKVVVPGKDLIPVSVGSSSKAGNDMIIEDFNGDEAILVLARAFLAEDYPFIKVNLSGFTRYSKFKILWRQADNQGKTHALEFNRSGDEVTQIAMAYGGENYRGQIADIALLFYDGPALGSENNNDVDIVIRDIEFLPFSAASVAEQIFEDWTNPPLWNGSANNFVKGAHNGALLLPNQYITPIVIVAVLLCAGRRLLSSTNCNGGPRSHLLVCAVILCLYGWAINETLRLQWRAEQLADAQSRFSGRRIEDQMLNDPIRCSRFPDGCGEALLPLR